jgi:alanine racemase
MHALFRLLRAWRVPPATLIEVRISSDALIHNYVTHKETYGLPVAPVLKSNAYGHGLLPVARVLESQKPPLLVVDSYFEAETLRQEGIRTPILIVGFVAPKLITRNRLRDVSFVATSLEMIEMLVEFKVQEKIHVKLDTGMHRQGLLPEQVPAAIALLQRSRMEVEGVCSHFASADSDIKFTERQIAVWNSLVPQWRDNFPRMRYWHMAASAGSFFSDRVDANLIRLGSGLYGFERVPERALPLLPVLSMHSMLTIVKAIRAGDSVGYNNTFTAVEPRNIATVPVGYFEGYDRRLSNQGVMRVNSVECPVIGRVSMNMSTIDVTECPDALLGTSVEVISAETGQQNSVASLSTLCDMSPLEFMVHIPSHLRRVIV